MEGDAVAPAGGQRRGLVVRGQHGVEVGAAEQGQHREVGLPVPAVRRRVDQPGPVRRPQHVARPEVAVQPRRRLGWAGQLREPIAHALDHGGLVGGQVAGVAGRRQVGRDPVRGVPRCPLRGRDVAHRRPTDPGVLRGSRRPRTEGRRGRRPSAGPRASHSGCVQRREPPAELGGRGCRRPSRRHVLGDEPRAVVREHRRHRWPASNGEPAEPGRLRGDPRALLDHHRPAVGQLHPRGTPAQRHGPAHRRAQDRGRGNHSWALTYSSSPGIAARVIVSTSVKPSGPP